LPVQEKILKGFKQFVIVGPGNIVRISMEEWGTLTEVPHFYRIMKSHFLLKDLFQEFTHNQMDNMINMISRKLKPGTDEEALKEIGAIHSHLCISTIEYETIIVLWLKELQKNVHFVTGAMPIINQLKGFMVMENETEVLDICHKLQVNHVLGGRFRKYKEHDLRSLVAKIVSASQYRDHQNLKFIAVCENLKVNDEEFFELSQIFNIASDMKNMIQS